MNLLKYFTLLLIFLFSITFASIHVTVEPEKISLQDNFRLIFTSEGESSNQVPDFSSLETHFVILGTGKSTSVSIINNKYNVKTEWILNLQAKQKGTFTIPSINFGNETSRSFALKINENTTASPSHAGADIFMRVSINKKESYVQAQLIYKVKLYYAKRLTSGNFSTPKVKNALLLQLGKSKTYRSTILDKVYQVSEQDYAIFPEKSGTLLIKAPIFQGVVQRDDYSNINQLLMDVHKPIKITTTNTSVNVLPMPPTYKASTWLPASHLSLSERWEGLTSAKVGEPITRIISMRANGLTGEQLPTLPFNTTQGANVYPQKPKSTNVLDHNEVIGKKTIRVVYIPSKAGSITIPEISLLWWNITSQQQKVATLQKKVVTIAAAANQPPPPAQAVSSATKPTVHPPTKTNQSLAPLPKSSFQFTHLLPWLLTILLAITWLIYLFFRMYKKNKSIKDRRFPSKNPNTFSFKTLSNQLKAACVKNDAKAAQKLLLTWAKNKWSKTDFFTLSDLKSLSIDRPLIKAIDDLEMSLYSEAPSWHGHTLWVAWLAFDKKKKPRKKDFQLPELNPKND